MLDGALTLLRRIGALDAGRLTPLGERLRALPLHPRLGAVLVAGRGAVEGARRVRAAGRRPARTRGDGRHHVQRRAAGARHVVAAGAATRGRRPTSFGGSRLEWPDADRRERLDEAELRRALLAGLSRPRRQAARGGIGASAACRRAPAPNWRETAASARREWLVALDVAGAASGGDARVFAASAVEREWLRPTQTTVEHTLTDEGRVRANPRDVVRRAAPRRGALRHRSPTAARALLAEAYLSRPRDEATTQLLRRLRFIGAEVDLPALVAQAAAGARSVDDIDLASHLPWELQTRLDARGARNACDVPSGRTAALDYRDDGSVAASVKLQELFGLAETPRIGPRARAGASSPAGAQRTARADHARLEELLGANVSGGAEGVARALPAASLARRSVDCHADGANQAERS